MRVRYRLQWIFGLLVIVAATFATLWLAGFFILVLSKTNPLGQVHLTTWGHYWHQYQNHPIVAKRLITALLMGAGVSFGLPIALLMVALRERRKLYGEARFASTNEIAAAGLFKSSGILVGKVGNRFLTFDSMQFVLLSAPTRSGKGVSIVIPNLLHWPDSVVVQDIKLENFLITSRFRAQTTKVYLFNPFAMTEAEDNPLYGLSHRYNPLGYISSNPHLRVTDILAIGYTLYPGDGREAFFDNAARNLFLGLTLYLCETPSLPCTLGELLRQSSGFGKPLKDHLRTIILKRNYREVGILIINDLGENPLAVTKWLIELEEVANHSVHLNTLKLPYTVSKKFPKTDYHAIEALLNANGVDYTLEPTLMPMAVWDGEGLPPLTAVCMDALNRFIGISDNTQTSVLATFNVPLTPWASPVMDAATAANDFDLRDLRKERISLYIGIPANQLPQAQLLLNILHTQLIHLNTHQLLHATPELRVPCLLLMDEFTAPGRIAILDKANAYIAGYGLRLLTIVQSVAQLSEDIPRGYGKASARTLTTNHALHILFCPKDINDAKEYSERLGTYTATSRNKNWGRGTTGYSESSGEGAGSKRPLLLPQELQEMPLDKQIIMLEHSKPIRCQKIFYHQEAVFMDRLKMVSKSLEAFGKKFPSKIQFESIWGKGELAASIPLLDLDLHEAMVTQRIRALTLVDVKQGIDLKALTLDLNKIPKIPKDKPLEIKSAQAWVNGFFDWLEEADKNVA